MRKCLRGSLFLIGVALPRTDGSAVNLSLTAEGDTRWNPYQSSVILLLQVTDAAHDRGPFIEFTILYSWLH